jgi:hypothetical protein
MRVILATILGFVIGNTVNFAIISLGKQVEPKPGMEYYEAIAEAVKSFTTTDFMIPLAGHLLGLLVGLVIARFICRTSRLPIYIIGGLYLIGALVNDVFMIPSPTWFIAVDLIGSLLLIIIFLRLKIKK